MCCPPLQRLLAAFQPRPPGLANSVPAEGSERPILSADVPPTIVNGALDPAGRSPYDGWLSSDGAASSTVSQAESPRFFNSTRAERPRFFNSKPNKANPLQSYLDDCQAPRAPQSEMTYLDMPDFKLEDGDAWLDHLDTFGVVVLKDVVPMEDVEKARCLYWDWLESLGSGLKRDDPSTWSNTAWPGIKGLGFTTGNGGAVKAAWFLRAHPRVTQAFAAIWRTTKLLTSFDTFIAWRPWYLKEDMCRNQTSEENPRPSTWKPQVENLHVDRNPFHRSGRTVVQGMLPLYPVSREVGGLQLVAGSQRESVQQDLRELYPNAANGKKDWLELDDADPRMGTGQLVRAGPGDLILWDSRTVHGGYVGSGNEGAECTQAARLARLALTVCQTPYASMEAGREESIIASRWEAFRQQLCTSMTPHEHAVEHTVSRMAQLHGNSYDTALQVVEMTDTIRDLIGNTGLVEDSHREAATQLGSLG